MSYAEAGLPVAQVLQFATRNGARALGKAGELGVIRAGAFADIVAFQGDFASDFAGTLRDGPVLIMQDGIIHRGPEAEKK